MKSEPSIYLDYNATTPLHPEVKKTMLAHMEVFGNPSSMHSRGRQSKALLDDAREMIARFMGAAPAELIFVGSGSEANNTVLQTFACQTSGGCSCSLSSKRPHIITTAIEHPCVLETAKCLAQRGMDVSFLDVDSRGRIDLNQLKSLLSEKETSLVSVMMANNEIGTLQDIKEITKIAHEHGALMHTDAVQAFGKIPLDVKDLGVDFLSVSAHKIYGPKGVGALYIKQGTAFCPLIRGGHQEKGRRAGTENLLGITAFAKAVEMRALEMNEEAARLSGFKNDLQEGLSRVIPDIRINGDSAHSLANTLNISFAGAEGEAILLYLDLEGIAVSTGSACASGSLDPSHVLLATGLGAEFAHGSIRFSMGRDTSKEDIEYILSKVPPVIEKIRMMSSAYQKRR